MGNVLSIIIANKDHAPTLARQLASIKSQTEKFDEVIVIDDGSERDNSKEVIQKFYDENKDELNVKIELNYENKGVVATINTGFDMSECDYLYFGSADDYLLPDFAKRHREIIEKYSPPMVTSDHHLPKQGFCKGLQDMGWYYIPGHCTSFERGALLEFGKFIEEFSFKCDWFPLHAIALKYGWHTIRDTLSVKEASGDDSYSSAVMREGKYPVIQQAMEFHVLNTPLFDDIRNDMLYLIRKP